MKNVSGLLNLCRTLALLIVISLPSNYVKAQAIECTPCNFTPHFPETVCVADLSFVEVGLDLNQPIQEIIQPLTDAVYDLLGTNFDVTGLIALSLATNYNNELICPGETIPLAYQAIDIKGVIADFDVSDLVSGDDLLELVQFDDLEELALLSDLLGINTDFLNITLNVCEPLLNEDDECADLDLICAACVGIFGDEPFTIVDLRPILDPDLYAAIETVIDDFILQIADGVIGFLPGVVGDVFDLLGGSYIDIFVDTDGDGNFDTQILNTDNIDFLIDFDAPDVGLIETGIVQAPVNLTKGGNITARILLNGMSNTNVACPCPTQETFHFGVDIDIPVVGIDVGVSCDFNYYFANWFDLVIPVNIDEDGPELTMSAEDVTVECNGIGNASDLQTWLTNNGNAEASDDCTFSWETPVFLYETDLCNSTNIYAYEFCAVDANGNKTCDQATFTIEDTTAPNISVGQDITVNCDANAANNDAQLLSWLSNNGGSVAVDVCSQNVIWSNNFEFGNYDYDCGETRSIDVIFTAIDDCGNSDEVTLSLTLIDESPPEFINCPTPDIVENIETGHCDAYVNFSTPIAQDNCSQVTVENISPRNPETGEAYKSGDRFPAGTTIITYKATDVCGNITICKFKIIVNDYWDEPIIICPEDITANTDDWECAADVTISNPGVSDICPDLVITTYEISMLDDEDTKIILETGLVDIGDLDDTSIKHNNDPSDDLVDFNFPVGKSTVTYCVQDQPLLLISEITQDVDNNCGGMDVQSLPLNDIYGDIIISDVNVFDIALADITVEYPNRDDITIDFLTLSDVTIADITLDDASIDDYIEITNFGPATYDLSCLVIERNFSGETETFVVPEDVTVAPGDVFTLGYIDVDFDDITISDVTIADITLDDFEVNDITINSIEIDENFFLTQGRDLNPGEDAYYSIYYGENLIDDVTISQDATGGMIRIAIKDTNSPDDWELAGVCNQITIGKYNPGYPQCIGQWHDYLLAICASKDGPLYGHG